MRRLYWIVGGAIALIVVIGGLTYMALRAQTRAFAPGLPQNSATGTGAAPASEQLARPTAPPADEAREATLVPAAIPTAVEAEPLVTTGPVQATPVAAPEPLATPGPAQQSAAAFTIGQSVVTKPPVVYDLWAAPTGGDRVFDRPKLYTGALVTVLAIEPEAVKVRTPEGVEGWIRAPAVDALTDDLSVRGRQAEYSAGTRVRVVWSNGIPLRQEPRPNAPKVLQQITAGQECTVQELRGDWLLVVFDDGTAGWARWYYDETIYIEVVTSDTQPQPTVAAQVSDFRVVGVRAGTADGQRVRVVIDLARETSDANPNGLFIAPPPGATSDAFTISIRARGEIIPEVQYLADRARELTEISATLTPDGLQVLIVPKTLLHLREAFFLPRDAPDSPSQYDRVVVDLCFTADCPPVR